MYHLERLGPKLLSIQKHNEVEISILILAAPHASVRTSACVYMGVCEGTCRETPVKNLCSGFRVFQPKTEYQSWKQPTPISTLE